MTADVLLTPEEWAETSTEVAILGTDPTAIERADPEVAAAFVTKALEESRSWLAVAMQRTDPTEIADFKAWAATVEAATRQKKLGREIELDAAEMVRRAERGIGVAIRNGQETGEIRQRGRPQNRDVKPGETSFSDVPSPTDFASSDELYGNDGANIYGLTDGVPDERFEEAITQAKVEGNLSRANVARKVKGKSDSKPTDEPATGETEPAAKKPGRPSKRHVIKAANVRKIADRLSGYQQAISDQTEIDPTLTSEEAAVITGDLSKSIAALQRLNRLIKERTK